MRETTAELVELAYNVHRWFEHQSGRYTQPDPLGIIDGDPHLYAYGQANPLSAVDPLGLAAKVCCRLVGNVFAGTLSRQRHCYIKGDDGAKFSLFPEEVGGRTLGVPRITTLDPREVGGTCRDCPCEGGFEGQNKCFRDGTYSYPVGTYSTLGPNSNTFAGTLARACCKGGVPDDLGSTPGIDDMPPPDSGMRAVPSFPKGRTRPSP